VLYDGTVRLMDFGAARAKQGMLHQVRPGSAHGKVPYMAPEQLAGHEPDCRFDVWSIGVVLWELLTGMPLFDGRSSTNIAQEVQSKRIPLVTSLNPRVPAPLAAIVSHALTRNPTERYSSARELSVALETLIGDTGESVPAAEVASWVDRLFTGRADDRRGLRAMARAIGDQLMPPSVCPFGNLESSGPAQPTQWPAAGKTIEVNLPTFTQTVNVDVPVPAPAAIARNSKATLLISGAAVLLLSIGVGVFVWAPKPAGSPVEMTPVMAAPPSAAARTAPEPAPQELQAVPVPVRTRPAQAEPARAPAVKAPAPSAKVAPAPPIAAAQPVLVQPAKPAPVAAKKPEPAPPTKSAPVAPREPAPKPARVAAPAQSTFVAGQRLRPGLTRDRRGVLPRSLARQDAGARAAAGRRHPLAVEARGRWQRRVRERARGRRRQLVRDRQAAVTATAGGRALPALYARAFLD
jgi:serine/threonine-protein kinase